MIKLIKSTFYKESETKKELIKFIKLARQLSFGLQCQKFENSFAEYQERRYSVFLNRGSSANLVIIQALLNLGIIKKGDKVGFSAVTWSTNIMPIIQLGLESIPIDVELDTLNISSKKLLECIAKYPIKLLFITNLLGLCDDIDKITRICKKKKIILIEDNCESLGTTYKGKKLGNFGLASTFSFYVGHHLSTIEGGMVCTDDKNIAVMSKIVRTHGWDRNLEPADQAKLKKSFKIKSNFYDRYTFYDLGYNFRPTEMQGFLGNYQLKYIDKINKMRNKNFLKLALVLYQQTNKYYPLHFDHVDFVSNFAVPLICKTKEIRDGLIKKCKNRVEIRPIVAGDMTKQPFFQKYYQNYHSLPKCPNTSIIHEQGLYFGNNPELTNHEIKELISIFGS